MRVLVLAITLLAGASLFASPVITSVNPTSGPIEGGTTVVIHGSGFSTVCIVCLGPANPQVFFGGMRSPSVTFIDSTRLEAVTPPHTPGTVAVTVTQLDGSDPNHFTLENAFTYTGDVYEAFDPILFPIFLPPIEGQGGSEFRTRAKFWNRSLNRIVSFYGLDTSCTLIDPPLYPEFPFQLAPRAEFELYLWPECSTTIGKLFFVPKNDKSIAASLRVYETSKQSENHGVEIPVARIEDFDEESIALLDVPTDPKFRLTLRVYGLNRGSDFVHVMFGGRTVHLTLRPGANVFEPSYAEWTDFQPATGSPAFPETITVLVDVPRGPGGVVIPGTPIWAFISVTNNDTQHITTITPQH